MGDKLLSIRLTKAQLKALKWMARKYEVTMSEFLRACLLQAVLADKQAPQNLLLGWWNTPLLMIDGVTTGG